ncbi:glycosyltransferase family 87 protein [uncultured Jatrophihabitans sp.]|uniref:glycosyltransferase family 87 protein n=1 Tax=uncultured Jatrophihabitans sp. TaxID=1610747 RepID=UPI0035CA0793
MLTVLWPCRRLLNGTEVLDLKVYLAGGRAVLHGHDLYSSDVGVRQYGFTYPPFAALLFAGPSLLPLGLDIVLMTLLSLGSLTVLIGLSDGDLLRRLSRTPTVATLVLVVALVGCQPVRTTLWNGQVDLLLAAMVMVDLVGRRGARGEGVLVGLAAAIKLTPAIFVGYLLLRRRFRAAGTAAVTFAVVTGGSWLLLPHSSTKYWTDSLSGAPGWVTSPAPATSRCSVSPNGSPAQASRSRSGQRSSFRSSSWVWASRCGSRPTAGSRSRCRSSVSPGAWSRRCRGRTTGSGSCPGSPGWLPPRWARARGPRPSSSPPTW